MDKKNRLINFEVFSESSVFIDKKRTYYRNEIHCPNLTTQFTKVFLTSYNNNIILQHTITQRVLCGLKITTANYSNYWEAIKI